MVNARTDYLFYAPTSLFFEVFGDFYAEASTLYLTHALPLELPSLANSLWSKVVGCLSPSGKIIFPKGTTKLGMSPSTPPEQRQLRRRLRRRRLRNKAAAAYHRILRALKNKIHQRKPAKGHNKPIKIQTTIKSSPASLKNYSSSSRSGVRKGRSLKSDDPTSGASAALQKRTKTRLSWPYNEITALALPPGLARDRATGQEVKFQCGCMPISPAMAWHTSQERDFNPEPAFTYIISWREELHVSPF